jgi:hypothetical protein
MLVLALILSFDFLSSTTAAPDEGSLLFSAKSTSLAAGSGDPAGIWNSYVPSGQTLVTIATPTIKSFGGVKWIKILRGDGDGYRLMDPVLATPGVYQDADVIAVTGVTAVVVAKPIRNAGGDGWNSIVDIFYDELVLGIRNSNGQVCVRRKDSPVYNSAATIPEGQVTVLSLVVQQTGQFKVFANGTEIMDSTLTATVDSLMPGTENYKRYINVGRNNPDGWTTWNGYIGDVYVYKKALGDTARTTLEAELTAKFITNANLTFTTDATAGANGSISPSGTVSVVEGYDQTFAITADPGYQLVTLQVDGSPAALVSSYSFSEVAANHTIHATFAPSLPYTITATAGAGGSIVPSGAVVVMGGDNQTFGISANTGFRIGDVLVDDVSQGERASSYAFNLVSTNHTIAVTFAPLSMKIPKTELLLFSVVSADLPGSGPTGNWPGYVPSDLSFVTIGNPAAETIDGVIWESNLRSQNDGHRLVDPTLPPPGNTSGVYADTDAIAVNGVTVVVAAKPKRDGIGAGYTSIVDFFYDELVLGIKNDSGQVCVRRKNSGAYNSVLTIPDGQATVLSLVVQPTGQFKAYTNGVEMMSITDTAAVNSLQPGSSGFMRYINIGRNNPDGWTVYNGNIGDMFVYRTALSDEDRAEVEYAVSLSMGLIEEKQTGTVLMVR